MIYLAFLFHLITLKIVSFFPSFSYFSLLSHSQSPESGEKNISLGSFLYIRKVHCAIQYNPDKPRDRKVKWKVHLVFILQQKIEIDARILLLLKRYLRHGMPNLRKHC